jgi:hypothetical protein
MVMMISIYAAYAKALEKAAENLGHTVLLVVTVRLQCVVNEVIVPLRFSGSPGAGERLYRTPPGATGIPNILFEPHTIAKLTLDLSIEVPTVRLRYLLYFRRASLCSLSEHHGKRSAFSPIFSW